MARRRSNGPGLPAGKGPAGSILRIDAARILRGHAQSTDKEWIIRAHAPDMAGACAFVFGGIAVAGRRRRRSACPSGRGRRSSWPVWLGLRSAGRSSPLAHAGCGDGFRHGDWSSVPRDGRRFESANSTSDLGSTGPCPHLATYAWMRRHRGPILTRLMRSSQHSTASLTARPGPAIRPGRSAGRSCSCCPATSGALFLAVP